MMGQGGSLAKAVLVASLLAGLTYLFGLNAENGSTASLAWKGAGVWLLAIYAALNARSSDGWMLVAVMGLGALGDVLVERDLTTGAVAFAAGHVIASILYLRHRRPRLTPSQQGLAIILVPAVVIITAMLTRNGGAAIYSLFLAVMASSAWISRFPRLRTGIGAMMFVASDLFIFAREGGALVGDWLGFAIWGLYFCGQVLIVLGVTQTLNRGEDSGLSPS